MILDTLENSNRYLSLNPGFSQAFEFLKRSNLNELATGKYPIDGENIFAIVAKEAGREKENAELESHQQYIDIQFVLSNIDTMGWKPTSQCQQPSADYDQKRDLQFFKDPAEVWVAVHPGSYAIFFPEDAHMPLIASETIHKVIVKVRRAIENG